MSIDKLEKYQVLFVYLSNICNRYLIYIAYFNSLIFSKIPDISLTAVKFPDISRFSSFSRQVVTLYLTISLKNKMHQKNAQLRHNVKCLKKSKN